MARKHTVGRLLLVTSNAGDIYTGIPPYLKQLLTWLPRVRRSPNVSFAVANIASGTAPMEIQRPVSQAIGDLLRPLHVARRRTDMKLLATVVDRLSLLFRP